MKLINIKIHEKPNEGIYIGRPSVFGNPFVIGKDGDREEVIDKYRSWLLNRVLERNSKVIAALKKLNDDNVLVCYCSPLKCHGEIIIEFWTEIMMEGDFNTGLESFIKKYNI